MNTSPTSYKLVSPIRATLEENVERASLTYGKASELQKEAWQAFNDAVDNNESNRVRNDLFENAVFAESVQKAAWHLWDDAKTLLLSFWN